MEKKLTDDIVVQALEELDQEEFRRQVEEAKQKIRNKKKHWFPWRIKIINLNLKD